MKNVEALADLTSSFGLSQFVVGPSHKLGHTLDLVFANRHEFDLPFIHPSNEDVSDHFPLLFKLPNFNQVSKPVVKKLTYRNIKSVDRVEFSRNLRNLLDTKMQSTDMDNVDFCNHYKMFSECATEELDRSAPIISKSLSGTSQPPWMDAEYRHERALRRRLERVWKASCANTDKVPYVAQRKLCAKLVISEHTKYFSDMISKCEGDQHALFKIVSTVMDKQKSSGVLPQCDDSKMLANKFNNFYSNKVLQIRNKIKPSKLACDYRQNFNGVVMESVMPTTVDELRKIIHEMGIKTSYHDTLPGSLFKDIIEDLFV